MRFALEVVFSSLCTVPVFNIPREHDTNPFDLVNAQIAFTKRARRIGNLAIRNVEAPDGEGVVGKAARWTPRYTYSPSAELNL